MTDFTREQIAALEAYCEANSPGFMALRYFNIVVACAEVETLLNGHPDADPDAHIALGEALERFGCDSIYWPLQKLARLQKRERAA